ncbi:autotransporter-associated beta strand repeat-containing protein [Cupriavidus sp. AU9028]|uniref:autotransporter-associated beta strand repeat-containing protein n=1 Tax=Cupriavidus sp. AU9028 TaxID=2871157 RepID=UPI001C93CE42|nr:autotransporter-associated beta strand repeat-containing protein [Cupriavidus sp. AU9028]
MAGPFRAWDNAAYDTAVFGGTAGTVTANGTLAAGGLNFLASGYTLTGGTITLGGATPTISTGNAGTTIIYSTLAGTGGFTKSGAGALSLGGTNTFSGDIRVAEGTLSVTTDAGLGASGNVVSMAGNTTLYSSQALAANRTIVLEGGSVRVQGASGSARFTGAGELRAQTGVNLNNDASDFTGGVLFDVNGDAYFTSVGNTGEASSLGSAGLITFRAVNQYSDRLHYLGDGDTSNRDWAFRYSGGTSGAMFIHSGTGTLTLTGNIDNGVDLSRSMVISAQTGDLELLGQIGGSGASTMTFSGRGAQRYIALGGANTYSGATLVGHANAGTSTPVGTVTMRIQSLADTGVASSFGLGTGGGVTVVNNSVIDYLGAAASSNRTWTIGAAGQSGGASILNNGTGALSLSGDVTLMDGIANNGLTLGGGYAGANTLSGVVSGTGTLGMDGAAGSEWTLTGANTRTGAIDVNGGTLRAGSASAFGTTTDVTVDGGTLDMNGFDLAAGALSGTGGTVALGSGNLSVNQGSGIDTTYAGSITGTGGLTKLGAGTLTLTGANAYSGDTNVNGGTLNLDFSAAGAPASDIISSASTLNMSGGALTVNGAAGATNSQTFDGLNIAGGNNTVGATAGAGGTVDLNLGAITHNGGLVDFVQSGTTNITTSNTALGGWATVNGTDYAKVEGGAIVAFTEDDYTDQDNAATWQNGQYITDVDGFHGEVGGTVQLAGLRYTEPTATTVTVAAGQTLGVDGTIIVAPTVDANDQVITGGSITGTTGGGELGVQQNSTGNFTIGSQIVDNGGSIGFTKAGSGLVTLANAGNDYTGSTTVGEGTLSVANIGDGGVASSIGASTSDASNLVIQGATLQYTGATATSDRGFTLGRSGAVQHGTIDVTQAASTLTLEGEVVSPDGAGLTKTGAGTLALTNANSSYTGVTTVNGGTLAAQTLADGGANSSIGASSSDSANLVLNNGGTLAYTGTTDSTDRGFTLGTGGGGIGVSDGAATLTMSGTVVGDGRLAKSGPGTLVLSGANTYTGGTQVQQGTLQAGSTTAFGSTTGTMIVETGATLDLADFNNTVGSLNGGGTVDLGSATLTSNGVSGIFTGAITGTGGVTRTGQWTQTILGAGNTYTGRTIIDNGTMAVDSLANGGQASGIGASTSDPANLALRRGTLSYSGGSITIDRGFALETGFGRIQVDNVGTTLGFSGNVVGTGTLYKSGPGTMVLNAQNTYTGGTVVEGGTLRAGTANAFGPAGTAGALSMANVAGATLDLNGFDTALAYLGGGGAAGGDITMGDATLTLRTGGNSYYYGAISGTGDLIKNGGLAQRLHGCNSSYSGSTAINGGSIEAMCLGDGGENSSIGASTADASNLVLNGGSLRYVGTGDTTDRQFTVGLAGGTLDASGTGALNFTNAAPITFAGSGAHKLTLTGSNTANNTLAAQITDGTGGSTSLDKTAAGTWVLTNQANSYTGATTILGGVLSVDKLADGGQASSIGASSGDAANLVIGQNGTLRYTGAGDTTDRLFTLQTGVTFIESSGTGALVFENTAPVTLAGTGARTVGLGGTNTDLNTLGGAIADGPGGATTLAKNGAGTWMLTGDNTYTGPTVINDGMLVVGNGGTSGNVGTGNIVVDKAASTLAVNRSDTVSIDGMLTGAGALAQIGTGTTVLTSTGSSIGATRIAAGELQVDGELASATIDMTGNSALTVNGTVGAYGGVPAALTGDAGNSTIAVAATGLLRANGDLGAGNDIVDVAGTLDTAAAALTLGAGDDTLRLRDGAVLAGTGVRGGSGNDLLAVDNAAALTLDGGSVSEFERLGKTSAGQLTLTGDHVYAAGTTISAGTVQVGAGGTSGTLAGDVTNNGTLAFNRADAYTFGDTISGTGAVNQVGAGTTVLTGTNSYGGATNVLAGGLLVNGDQSAATGATSVASGAMLGGAGTIGGNVTVAGGATLSPGASAAAPGTLTINGDLQLAANSNLDVSFGQANVVGGPLNDLVQVGGDLTLDGTINVTETAGGTFGPGVYRVISYDGTLNDQGATVNSPLTSVSLQTSVDKQVNLVNSAGQTLNFWDGDGGPKNNATVNGGNGTWQAAGDDRWTGEDGVINGAYSNASFAVFAGAPGTVTVDDGNGAVEAAGMQFATDGYRIQGDPVGLSGAQAIVRVGDGTTDGAGYTATIASDLSGTSELAKTDLGTLVLEGTNTYTGGTRIDGGTVSIAADANLGDAAGGLTLNGGTLQTTADLSSGRAVTLAGNGTIATAGGTTAELAGAVAGAGALTKDGAGTLALGGDAAHTGGTTIAAGTLQVGTGGTTGSLAGDVANRGTLAFARSDAYVFDGIVSGTGAVSQTGPGTTILTANHTYTGGTAIDAGTLQLGNGAASGMIGGDVTNDGTLAFNRNDTVSFDGSISGTGAVRQDGTGTTILTAGNSYGGATTVNNGTLLIQGDQSLATGATSVNAGTLGGTGVIGGDVAVAAGATVAPGGQTNVPGTLTINGDLALDPGAALAYNFGQAGVVGGAYNDLIEVGGDLALAGTIDVTQTPGGNFGPGVYRVISYDGALSTGAVTVNSPDYYVQTSIAQQVNLVNTNGLTLRYWDGAAGARNDGQIDGGDGVWQGSTGNDNWTEETGSANAPFQQDSFAVFAGAPGTVTVDNDNGVVRAAGMQFATDGYRIEGDPVTLSGTEATIRVGDGTLDGAGYTATIASELSGSSQLVKTDLGTLVLEGNNTYTGGTRIDGGTVRISSDANLGDLAGGLTMNGGTLQTTADLSTGRAITLVSDGTVITDAGTTATLGGAVSGTGSLTKDGAGTLALTGDAAHSGGTTIAAGTLQIGDGGTTGSLAGDVVNSGTLAFNRSDAATFDGTISGTGAVRQSGSGTIILTRDSSYSGGTTIDAGTLQLGDGGTTGMISGDVTNNGTLAFRRADAVSFAGVIGGSGGVRQDGPGTTELTAANRYTGATTVTGGTLLIQGDQSLATGATTVTGGTLGGTGVIGGDVTVTAGANLTPGAAPGDAGTLTINGDLALDPGANLNVDFGQSNTVGGLRNDLIEVAGDLSLGGTLNVAQTPGGSFGPGVYRVISYGGDLVGGTLALGSMPSGARAALQTAIAQQINLVNASDNALSFWDGDNGGRDDGTISGGDGTWRAGGDTNWTEADGATNAAFLPESFAVFGAAPGTVTVDSSQGDVRAAGMQFASSGYTLQGDRIVLTGDAPTIRVGDGTAEGANYVATINAALGGSGGMTKSDAGTLVLGGVSDYTGATTVEAGTLAVNGSIAGSPVSVRSGATLAGNGTVGSTTVAAGGNIAPAGNASGTLNVSGDYAQQAGSTYQVHVDPTSAASDRIAVTGRATLDEGARLNVTKTSNAPYVADTRYTVLTAAGGLDGTFTLAGDTAVTAFLGLRGDYDANNAYLVVQQSRAIEDAGQTPNQQATGRGVESLPAGSGLKDAVLNLADDATARSALDQLSGEIHASLRTASIEDSRYVREAATDRLRETFCAAGSAQDKREGGASPRTASDCGPDSTRPAGWARVFGAWGSTNGNGNAGAMDTSTGGILLGADAPVAENWRVGALAGYSRTSVDVDSRRSSGSTDNYHAGIYGGGQWGALGLRAGAAYTWQDISTSRSVAFANFRDHASGDYHAGMAQVFGDLGYRIDAGRVSYEPFVSVAHVNLDTKGFNERGGASALNGQGDTSNVTFSTLGLRSTADIQLGSLAGTLRGSLGWRHAFGDRTPVSTVGLRGGDSFGVAGVPIAQDAAVIEAGLDVKVGKATTLGVSYSGQFAGDSRSQTVKGMLKVLF